MKVTEPNDDKIIIQNSPIKARVAIVVLTAVWLFVTFTFNKGFGFSVILSILLGLWWLKQIFFDSKTTECFFDRRIGQMQWLKKGFGPAQSVTIPFKDIQKVAHRESTYKGSTSYKIIITSSSHNPLIIGTTNDLIQYEHVVQKIKILLGREILVRDSIAGPLVVSEKLTPEEEGKIEWLAAMPPQRSYCLSIDGITTSE